MTTRLEKLGRIFTSTGQHSWMISHAQVPIAEALGGDLVRIYFTCRDARNMSHMAWLEIEMGNPDRVLRMSSSPLLGPGLPGTFDDCGAMTSWLVKTASKRHFFYIGWNIRTTIPFQNSIGLAIGEESANPPHIRRYSLGPILDRNLVDPYFCANPCVLKEGTLWRMWYLSGLDWEPSSGSFASSYDIRYAESDDGVNWRREGHVCIALKGPDEIAIARPCVVKDADIYRMWYCYRGRSFQYRIGYAESRDGKEWNRLDDQAGISASSSGWDSEMIAYPYVFDHRGNRYMLYCGNGYSKDGFGVAVFA